MRVEATVWEGTTTSQAQVEGSTLDQAFDQLMQRYPSCTRLLLEELGPGEDMVPIMDRVEVANG